MTSGAELVVTQGQGLAARLGWEGKFAPTCERRRQAQALSLWERARGDAPLPDGAAMGALLRDEDEGIAWYVVAPDAGGGGEGDEFSMAAALLRARWDEVARLRAPARCTAEIGNGLWRGMVLPLGGADGGVRSVAITGELVSGTTVANDAALDAVLGAMRGELARAETACAWSIASGGAEGLLARPAAAPIDAAAGLARARTWAALAVSAPPAARRRSLHAALGETFSLAGPVAKDGGTETGVAALVARVFGRSADAIMQAALVRAVVYGLRLGLARAAFEQLLHRHGVEALAGLATAMRDAPVPAYAPMLTLIPLGCPAPARRVRPTWARAA